MSTQTRAKGRSVVAWLIVLALGIGSVDMARARSEVDGRTEAEARGSFTPKTRVSVKDGRWLINGNLTHRGSAAEGLLMNVRMVNSVFEDRRKPDFDPEANTDRFLVAPARLCRARRQRLHDQSCRAACPATRGPSTRRSPPMVRCARRISPASGASSRPATGTAWS